MNLGEKIRQARKRAGLTQKELGQRLGVSQAAIGQFENNNSNPQTGTLVKISDALNISVEDLLSDTPFGDTIEETKAELSNVLEKRLLNNEAFKMKDGNYTLTFSSEKYSIEELTKILEYALFLKMQRKPEKTIELSEFLEGNF